MKKEILSVDEMHDFGMRLGAQLKGGDVLELVGDVGAGKTTLTKGIAEGLGVTEDVQSPSFTISRVYSTQSALQLAHYDFYRLHDPGIMTAELHEAIHDPETVTIIEWADIVAGVLPEHTLRIRIDPVSETVRTVVLSGEGAESLVL
jgi:tRNA threonylcarbamoyladenosine biosynthesis protein TsaE